MLLNGPLNNSQLTTFIEVFPDQTVIDQNWSNKKIKEYMCEYTVQSKKLPTNMDPCKYTPYITGKKCEPQLSV